MQRSNDYASDHLIAKVAIYFFYLLVGVISIECGNPYVALVFGTAIWLFGVNSTAYVVEAVRGHDHNHNVV